MKSTETPPIPKFEELGEAPTVPAGFMGEVAFHFTGGAVLHKQAGPLPKVPPGFWGDVIYRFQDGAVVLIEIRQTFKPS